MSTPKLLAAAISVVACANTFSKPVDVRLEISDDGHCTLQGKAVAPSDLRPRLLELKAANPDVQIHVTGSLRVSYSQMVPVMKLVEEVSPNRLRFAVEPPEASTSDARR